MEDATVALLSARAAASCEATCCASWTPSSHALLACAAFSTALRALSLPLLPSLLPGLLPLRLPPLASTALLPVPLPMPLPLTRLPPCMAQMPSQARFSPDPELLPLLLSS